MVAERIAHKRGIPEFEDRLVEILGQGVYTRVKAFPVALKHGDEVASLRVVACPGHSPGHVAFLDTRDRSLIAGDVFTSIGSVQVTNHFYLRFPFAQMATWDKKKDAQSARELTVSAPTLLAVGHGPAVQDPVARMEAAVRQASAAAGETALAASG